MRVLKLKDAYSREDIHGIFSPDTRFTKQSGTWGLQGIIKVPNTDVFKVVSPILISRGISRIVSPDQLIAL